MSRRTARPTETEPSAEPPPTDRLRIDIDRGLTGEKVDHPDPAAAPLGTDDEAGGHPASAAERRMEVAARHVSRSTASRGPLLPLLYLCAIVAVLLVLVALLVA